MAYKLAELSGDSVAVPRIVIARLPRADGDTIRVALYILGGGAADPAAIAHDLGLKSVEAAKRALLYWAGAGLLCKERSAPPPVAEEEKTDRIDLAAVMNDPNVAVLCEEAQTIFGKALGRSEMQRLVALHLNDGWQPDVILLCCAEVARHGKRTAGAVSRELAAWRDAGIETGEDAERHLKRLQQREEWCAETAAIFNLEPARLTKWERGAIARWHEDWHIGADMIAEALLRADSHNTVRYVDGILRSWMAQGLTTLAAVRGRGQLSGSNILATGAKPGQATAKKDVFQNNWTAAFDDNAEG